MIKRLLVFFRNRSTHELVNLMIEGEFYSDIGEEGSAFMCVALTDARNGGVINRREFRRARDEIQEHIFPYDFLEAFLNSRGHPSDFKIRRLIYRNWDNRSFKRL